MATSTSRSSGTSKSSEAGPAKKSSTKKTAPKTTQKDGASRPAARKGARAEPRPPARAGQVAKQAAGELLELTGKAAEGVTGLERTEDGWTVQVEVVEVRRIPDTTDVLALYEVNTDSHGSLLGYRRIRRYTRGAPGQEQ